MTATKQEITTAWQTVGNQSQHCLRNMIKALQMLPALNTEEDNKRLAAAKIAIKYPNPRYSS
jgi:hypothetical protein